VGILLFLLLAGAQSATCADVRECAAAARDAATREDYEAFHDLAWRAMQKGTPRDPDLMYLLARAQSLSGRPGDALVMLRRLAEQGISTDAATNEDFRRVRALPGWAEVEALMTPGAPSGGEKAAAAAGKETPAAAPARAGSPSRPAGEAISFEARPFDAGGLGYDAVSRRFVLGDRAARKLFVVDENSGRANDLVGAGSAGFYAVMGLEIDPRRGDLWVISAEEAGESPTSVLHKLQLVSGRPLASFRPSAVQAPVRFVDVAVASDGTVVALDAAGRRLLALRPPAQEFERVLTLDIQDPLSLARASGNVVYVSGASGLSRVDLSSGRAAAVKAKADAGDLANLERIRWHAGSLVAVQKTGDATRRIVRLSLDSSGRRVTKVDVIDTAVPASASGAATIAGDAFYYLMSGERGTIVRKVALGRR
jgi:hypothetical protein